MHLHEEIGPRATTISAIAERAGVQRLTVYRYFPDETAVFQACTSYWLSLNPPPDAESWSGVKAPWQRFRTALMAFYAYYAETQRMWSAAHRDVADVPALQGPMAEFKAFVEMIGDDLAKSLRNSPKSADNLRHTIQHALAFPTWADLEHRGLGDRQKVTLVEQWLAGIIKG